MPKQSTRPLLAVALALLPGAALPAEPPIGKLFFSPAERQQMARRPAPSLPPPRLDGIVQRSHGRPTLFLDGVATPADPRQVSIAAGRARVTGPDGQTRHLSIAAPP